MSDKEAALFFHFYGDSVYDIFDTSKTERAKAFPSFSNKPHAIQDDMGGHGVAISCRLTISIFFYMTPSSSKMMWAVKLEVPL